MRLRVPAVLLALATALGAGCGPSFQVVYEGDSRFEHCYALDDNPNVLMQQKSDCWSDWIKHYTYGQTRDRVEFAVVRYRAIMRAGSLPTDEAIMGAAPGEGTGANLATPAPTNAFAPPPKTLVEVSTAAEAGAPPPAPALPPAPGPASPNGSLGLNPVATPQQDAPKPPGATCVEGCSDAWQACRGSCVTAACAACDRTYGKCARTCLLHAP